MKKNVVHLTNEIGVNKGGGVKSFIVDYLSFNNDNNTLVFIGNKTDKESLAFLNVPIHIINYNLFNISNLKAILHVFKILKNSDCVYQHSLWRPISLFTTIAKKIYRKKTIIQPHGVLNEYAIKNKNKRYKQIFFKLIENRNIVNTDVLLVNSQTEYNEVLKLVPKASNIVKVYLGVKNTFINSQFFSSDKFLERYSSNTFLFISRIHPIKGLNNLILAFAEVNKTNPNFKLLIAGNGNLEYINELKELISQSQLNAKITFIGYADDNQKLKLLSNSKFFILPSNSESFSLSIAEALSRKVPVITSNNTLWKDYLPNNCGFITNCEIDNLITVINQSLNIDLNDYIKMSENAQRLINEKFVFETNINLIKDLYSE